MVCDAVECGKAKYPHLLFSAWWRVVPVVPDAFACSPPVSLSPACTTTIYSKSKIVDDYSSFKGSFFCPWRNAERMNQQPHFSAYL